MDLESFPPETGRNMFFYVQMDIWICAIHLQSNRIFFSFTLNIYDILSEQLLNTAPKTECMSMMLVSLASDHLVDEEFGLSSQSPGIWMMLSTSCFAHN